MTLRYVPLVPGRAALASEAVAAKVAFLETILDQDVAVLEERRGGACGGADRRFTYTASSRLSAPPRGARQGPGRRAPLNDPAPR